MKKAYLEMGYVCNNLCRHCFVPQTERKHDLKTGEIKRILDKMERGGFDVVAFTGGEPTLRRDLFELMLYAKKIGIGEIELQTNGRMLSYPGYAEKLGKAGLSKIYISIHSHLPETHDSLTQVKGSWDQTVRGIKNSVKAGLPVMTNTVISGINYNHVPDLVVMLSNLGIREIELDFVRFIGNGKIYFEDLKMRMKDAWPYLKKAFDLSKKLPIDMIYVDDYPLCMTRDYEKFNADSFGDGVHDDDAEHFNVDFREGSSIHENEKIFVKACGQCSERKKCQGIWKEYVEYFGYSEFINI